MRKLYIGIGLVSAGFILACSPGTEPTTEDIDRLNDNTSSAAPVKTKSVDYLVTGDYKVGKKDDYKTVITPGVYKVTTPNDGILCYWSRVRSFDNELNSIIANGNVQPGKSALVEVKASDKGFKLEHDCLAKKQKS